MRDKKEFYELLQSIKGRPYRDFSKLVGDFDFARYVLKISHIEEEGSPTLFVVRVTQMVAAFPPHLFNSPVRRTALEDLLARMMAAQIDALVDYDGRGIARRRLEVARPGQKILPRTAMVVTEEFVEARIYANFSAEGNRIDSDEFYQTFFEDLPVVVNNALLYCNLDEAEVDHFVDLMEDADQVRQLLQTMGVVAYVGKDSVLDRLPGTDRPDPSAAAALRPQAELVRTVEVPNGTAPEGWAIPSGLTVILGDAASGRRELMRALASGIFNHVPGDGREFVISVPDAVYVNAQPGRPVRRVNLSAFARKTDAVDTSNFTTESADATMSQAASMLEAIEIGARALLFDEDDSAPGFLGGDARVDGLFAGALNNVTLASQARSLVDDLGVSIVVAGHQAVGAFLPIADTVLRIENGTVSDITAECRQAGIQAPELPAGFVRIADVADHARWVVPTSIDPTSGRLDGYINLLSSDLLEFGRGTIELGENVQMADENQIETIGQILFYVKQRYLDEGRPVREIMDLIDRDLSAEGLECLSRELRGDLARPRRYEIATALNRLPSLRISHISEN